MEFLICALCALSMQAILGAGACALLSATIAPGLRACRRALAGPAGAAAAVGMASFGLGRLVGADPGLLVEPVRALFPGLFTAAGTIAAIGCHLVLHAARIESRRASEPPRALLRAGGKTMFVGAVLVGGVSLLSIAGPTAASEAGPVARWAVLLPGALGCGAGGFGGLLAGISAKPRPSGPIAAVVYGVGFVLLCAAASSG